MMNYEWIFLEPMDISFWLGIPNLRHRVLGINRIVNLMEVHSWAGSVHASVRSSNCDCDKNSCEKNSWWKDTCLYLRCCVRISYLLKLWPVSVIISVHGKCECGIMQWINVMMGKQPCTTTDAGLCNSCYHTLISVSVQLILQGECLASSCCWFACLLVKTCFSIFLRFFFFGSYKSTSEM